MFFVYLKSHKSCVGVRKYFLAVCQGVKEGVSKKCALFVFVFLCWKKSKKENMKKMDKENFKNRKIVKKRACSLQLSVLGKWSFFVAIPSDKTL